MHRFAQLFQAVDRTTRTREKVTLVADYFREAPDHDSAWAAWFLGGHRLKRLVRGAELRSWAGEAAGVPAWLVDECYHQVGDLADTVALLLPDRGEGESGAPGLAAVVEEYLLPLEGRDEGFRRERVLAVWDVLDAPGRLVVNKLLTGGFRVGVQRATLQRGLAESLGMESTVVAQRLMGDWRPSPDFMAAMRRPESQGERGDRPYPFCLAHPLAETAKADPGAKLGSLGTWQFEWKWDGIRGQLLRRPGVVHLWSRGEEPVGGAFPEVVEAALSLPPDTVLDGELVAWDGTGPAPFGYLQRRLGRKAVGSKLRQEVPVVFLAYDLLEEAGRDLRGLGTTARRRALENLLAGLREEGVLRLSPLVAPGDWEEVRALVRDARERRAEGLMIKHREAPFAAGRVTGHWWKWKTDPLTLDAVLIYAQVGHGRRAGLYTDYTFALRHGDGFVPIAKAYSGLDDAEIARLDDWIKRNTAEKFGPVRSVPAVQVFEIAFEGIAPSPRHKSGLALRFPRISRWRTDKKPEEADTLEVARALLPG